MYTCVSLDLKKKKKKKIKRETLVLPTNQPRGDNSLTKVLSQSRHLSVDLLHAKHGFHGLNGHKPQTLDTLLFAVVRFDMLVIVVVVLSLCLSLAVKRGLRPARQTFLHWLFV